MDYSEEQLADIEAKRIAAVQSAEAAATVAAAKEAEERTRKAILDELGGSPQEAAAALRAAQAAEAEAQTEIQKAQAALASSEARANEAESRANELLQNSMIADALIAQGVDPKSAKTLCPSVIVPKGADEAVIESAVQVLKANLPVLFQSGDESATALTPAAPKVDSHPQVPKPKPGQTKLSEGAAMFIKNNPHLAKQQS